MNLAVRVMKGLPWVTSELRTKKKEEPREELLKYRDQSVCYRDSESKTKRQRKLTIFKELN